MRSCSTNRPMVHGRLRVRKVTDFSAILILRHWSFCHSVRQTNYCRFFNDRCENGANGNGRNNFGIYNVEGVARYLTGEAEDSSLDPMMAAIKLTLQVLMAWLSLGLWVPANAQVAIDGSPAKVAAGRSYDTPANVLPPEE